MTKRFVLKIQGWGRPLRLEVAILPPQGLAGLVSTT